ncbi:zinc finger domain-containing protein [Rhodococcus pyridinivorans]|uniref:zinc finger domain-containing protein n=1 Tax=Rhodococcus pyridinivorans TaxID=103816 RepID=UPI0015866D77|nr:hypothetical protein [Rhodococcus pyridinivorans]
MRHRSTDEALDVPCPKCTAAVDTACDTRNTPSHRERRELAEQHRMVTAFETKESR